MDKNKNKNKILVIVESPAKCKKIESYLGENYKCISCYGHLRELKGLTSIDILNQFHPNYTIIEQPIKLKQIEILRKEIQKSEQVILATDDDREGEAIAWHICELFQLSAENTKRIVFHEITEHVIQNAILHPKTIEMNIVNAQKGRQILDLLVGFTISPILWENISNNHKNSLSAGRCQTPALRIIYDNYIDIKNSIQNQKTVYNVTAYFTNRNIPFELSKQFETERDTIFFLENTILFEHYLTISSPKQSFTSQPKPLSTSSLQQVCSNELHWSPKETMKYAQQLYENGLITYMRTDSKLYSSVFIEQIKDFIIQNYNDPKYLLVSIDQLIIKEDINSKILSHEAIRPIQISLKPENIKEDIEPNAKKLYSLIWQKTLESCMAPCITYYINASIPAFSNIAFKYKSEEIFFLGWKIVSKKSNNAKDKDKMNETNSVYHYLLNLKQNIKVDYKKIIANVTLKNTKSHYTEAMLVQLLEEKGIGRPSTYSTLVDKIQERGYVSKENIPGQIIKCREFTLIDNEITENITENEFGKEAKKMVIQPLGIIVMEFLINNFNELFHYDYTNQMENGLDLVARGDKTYYDICMNCFETINKLTNALKRGNKIDKKIQETIPDIQETIPDIQETPQIKKEKYKIKIDENHFYIIGKYGPVIQHIKGKKVDFLPVKKNIDINKLERGEYLLQDLLEQSEDNVKKDCKLLGKYKGSDLYIKDGKYGIYAQWDENKTSLKSLGKTPFDKINLLEVLKVLEKDDVLDPNVPVGLVRNISENISIRSGKFGDYLFYKSKKMKNPQFLKLKDFSGDYQKCDLYLIKQWIKETYNIE